MITNGITDNSSAARRQLQHLLSNEIPFSYEQLISIQTTATRRNSGPTPAQASSLVHCGVADYTHCDTNCGVANYAQLRYQFRNGVKGDVMQRMYEFAGLANIRRLCGST